MEAQIKPQCLTDLRQDLQNMGITPDDRLLIHSSLRAVGPIEDGAQGLIRLLTDYLDRGTLLMPAHTWSEINAKHPRFRHAETPSCVGTLSEIFRKTPGVIRSAHPTHSNCGWGRGVASLLADQERFDTPCHPRSTYGRLAEEGFKILLVGVDFSRNTTVHGLEEIAHVPGRLTEQREPLEVEFADGRIVASPQHRHTGPQSERYVRVEPMLLEQGVVRMTKLGRADVMLMEAAPLFKAVVGLLRKDPTFFVRDQV